MVVKLLSLRNGFSSRARIIFGNWSGVKILKNTRPQVYQDLGEEVLSIYIFKSQKGNHILYRKYMAATLLTEKASTDLPSWPTLRLQVEWNSSQHSQEAGSHPHPHH